MTRRTGWLWLALALPAGIALQLAIHAVISTGDTSVIRFGLAAASAVLHTAINLTLLWVFGRTLLPGREALITGFARKVHGTLPAQMERYTRHVTIAWMVFFAMQLIASAVLAALSLGAWSLFVNVLSFPLVVVMFVFEYAYRTVRHRDFPHATIWQGVQAFADDMRAAAPRDSRHRTHG